MSELHGRSALDYSFVSIAAEPRLDAYLAALFTSFQLAGQPRHQFEILPSEDGYELLVDGERQTHAPAAEDLVCPLVHVLNRRVIDSTEHLTIHAGGLEHDGHGLILPGVMEAGKTTLTAGLVRAGFGYLTDEAVALDRETLVIQPYPKPLSLDRGAWPLFPELEPQVDLDNDGYKSEQWQVPPTAIRPDALGLGCQVHAVVFPAFAAGAETVLEPMSRAEALIELAKHTFFFRERSRPSLDLLAAVVRDAACLRLRTGELDAAVEAVTAVMAG